MDGRRDGGRKTDKEKEGQHRWEIKGGRVDDKVDDKKSEKLIEGENKERKKWDGKNKKKKKISK